MTQNMPEQDPDYFRTIEQVSEGVITAKGSKFLARVVPVSGVEDAEHQLDTIRREFHDATHHCFAWRLGYATEPAEKYSDAGEPTGTAGRPILDAVYACAAWEVLLVVTRWYGGTKLGTGGLKRAYRQAADAALADAAFSRQMIVQAYRLSFDHDLTGVMYRVLDDFDTTIITTDFDTKARMELTVKRSQGESFEQRLVDAGRGAIDLERLGQRVR